MTGDNHNQQLLVLEAALRAGISWIDTAAGYGAGKSEEAIGIALQKLGQPAVNIATKVRLAPEQLDKPLDAVRESLFASLKRLKRSSCDLLYLHNAITPATADIAASVGLNEVLKPHGILDAMLQMREEGLVKHLAITATGVPECNLAVLETGKVHAMQIPFHLLNPSAAIKVPAGVVEMDYQMQIPRARAMGVRVFAIRVLAGGALAMQPPSAHTLTTPYFPLALFQKDCERAGKLLQHLPKGMSLPEAAIRFVLGFPEVDCVLLGLGNQTDVETLGRCNLAGPLPKGLQELLLLKAMIKNTSNRWHDI